MKKTVFVDDLTGDEAATSVTFGLDDKMYEIDLNDENAKELRETLDRYVRVAREKLMEQQQRNDEGRQAQSQQNSKEIRRWAKKQGYSIKNFGRIPAKVMQEWEDSQQGGQDRPSRRREDAERDRALNRHNEAA